MTVKLSTSPVAWQSMRVLADIAYKGLFALSLQLTADPEMTVSQAVHDMAEGWQEDMDEYLSDLSGTKWELASSGLYARVIEVINTVVNAPIET